MYFDTAEAKIIKKLNMSQTGMKKEDIAKDIDIPLDETIRIITAFVRLNLIVALEASKWGISPLGQRVCDGSIIIFPPEVRLSIFPRHRLRRRLRAEQKAKEGRIRRNAGHIRMAPLTSFPRLGLNATSVKLGWGKRLWKSWKKSLMKILPNKQRST